LRVPYRNRRDWSLHFEARKRRKDWRHMQEKEVRPNCIIYHTRLITTFLYQNTTNILKSINGHSPTSIPLSHPQTAPTSVTSFLQPTSQSRHRFGPLWNRRILPNRRAASNVVGIPHPLPYVPLCVSTALPPGPPPPRPVLQNPIWRRSLGLHVHPSQKFRRRSLCTQPMESAWIESPLNLLV
jgi:hypothetical protein